MHLCYFDESGDAGYVNSPTPTFTLATVIVDEKDWLSTLDQLVYFRKFLRKRFGLRMNDELKANYLIHNTGPFKRLAVSDDARRAIYRGLMRFQQKCGSLRTFAIVINKQAILKRTLDPRDQAWTYAIQRLERHGNTHGCNTKVFPDEGHGMFIRAKLRKMRRFSVVKSAFGGQPLPREAKNIIEDSSDRRSHESYFVQLADLNAYAAVRAVHPIAKFDGAMWSELGTARDASVNKVRGGLPGIVSWP